MSEFACFILKSLEEKRRKRKSFVFVIKNPRAVFLISRALADIYRLAANCGTINLIQRSVYIVIKSFFQLFTVTNRKKRKEKSISLPKTNKNGRTLAFQCEELIILLRLRFARS